ncbi:uroporphyrinogen-III C-methyltransferase [Arsukibacterium indicum]|uniref:Uroporphyrinogen-III C-methyltransferase n=1 Tax=Arsukibacterium indicum TaxID=2848612 RepID=A0ABS6MRR5_9GAMM|nr:uroporphyrinogen-III C-methyltransferase [Arsukibacterium indicum]MBV2130982.1 uroporphyrinogen-III C-methyltransferase [Arsukibacterium indicum]
MSEQAELTPAEESAAPLEQLKQQIADQEQRPAGAGRGLAWLALLLSLLLLAAVAAAGYWLWPQWQQIQSQQQQLQQAQQDINRQNTELLSSSQSQLQQSLSSQQQSLNSFEQQLKAELQRQQQQLQQQMQAVRELIQQSDGAPPRHWALAEIQFLLKRADYSLWLNRDINSARLLLQRAQQQLAELDDASLINVRQAIVSDLAALAELQTPDLSSVHLQLAQMRKTSMALPLKHQQAELSVTVAAPEGELKNWRSTLKYYWDSSLQQLFSARVAVPEDYFSLSEEQQLMVRVALNQQLLLAQLAALEAEPAVYRSALQQASDQLQRHFQATEPAVQQLSEKLLALAAIDITEQQLPALQSGPQLQDYLQSMAETEL